MTHPKHVATVWNKPISTLGLIFIFLGFALGLILQPYRWSATPAYGNLLTIFSAQSWGIIYIVIGFALFLYIVLLHEVRFFGMIVHTAAFVLLASWEVSFIIRWATDPKTTIANTISWLAFIAIATRSAAVMDYGTSRVEAANSYRVVR
jgi:hypothetical protein